MDSSNARVNQVFADAIEIESPGDRTAFLDKECGGDQHLRAQVDALLDSHARAGSFLELPATGLQARPDTSITSMESGPSAKGEAAYFDDAGKSVLKSLGKNLQTVPHVLLRDANGDVDPIAFPRSKEVPQTGAKYQLLGEIARGGIGAILKGRDTDIGRDLAVKVLLDEHRDKPEVLQRFIEEAQIGGQLQHPGIAPVYELGQFDDERPFFSMKLIKGETLSTLLAGRDQPTDDRGKLLAIFEQICQTMAYAHSRGVIHRDLKPSNIMVGAFGEVQVMDWGLAKVLPKGGVVDEKKAFEKHKDVSVIQTSRSVGSDTPGDFGSDTRMGSVLGTPAYMPPEQALGEIDHLDERSDVFGLGAILCEILTGQPPYVGSDGGQILRLATRGKLEDCFARLDESGADADLIKLSKRCLAPEPSDRPRDGGELADGVSSYLESVETKLRTAELERAAEVARGVEQRKRNRVKAALVASLLALLVVGGGAAIWLERKEAALAVAKAESELKALENQQRLSRQVSNEISNARTLAENVEPAGLADKQTMVRALEAIGRARSLIESAVIPRHLAAEASELEDSLQHRLRDLDLLEALEQAWAWEAQHLAVRNPNSGLNTATSRARRGLQIPEEHGFGREMHADARRAAEYYERAFADWVLIPDVTSIDEAVGRIQALPTAIQSRVLVSLDRWHRLLGAIPSLERWQKAEWSTLQAIRLSSRGGDELSVKSDGSILASGNHPQYGYELEFETPQSTITGLWLEALSDPSLPGYGPGRGTSAPGDFSIDGLRVSCAPLDDPGQKRQLVFRSAVTDHSLPIWRFATDSWSNKGVWGDRRAAYFEIDEPVRSKSGFRITITHADSDASPRWADENLGRFRWSVCAEEFSGEHTDWLAGLIRQADQDPWRRSMRDEIEAGDVAALVRRAEDASALQRQPQIVLIRLAEALRRAAARQLISELPSNTTWSVLEPKSVESDVGADCAIEDERWIFVGGEIGDAETIQVAAPFGKSALRAIRLEVAPDGRTPTGYLGRGEFGDLRLKEFSLGISPASDPDNVTPLDVTRALSLDLQEDDDNQLMESIDGEPSTGYSFPLRDQPNQVVFLTSLESSDDERLLHIRLSTGSSAQANLSRFRLSFTADPIDAPAPGKAALALLRRMHIDAPEDYWINLALAELFASQRQPDLQAALRYATAAVALRPKDPMSHAAVIGFALSGADDGASHLHEVARQHASRVFDLANSRDQDREQIALQYLSRAELALRQSKSELAEILLEIALEIAPDSSLVHYRAARLYRFELKDFGLAAEQYRQAIELAPENPSYWNELRMTLYNDGDHEAANEASNQRIDVLRQRLRDDPDDPHRLHDLSWALLTSMYQTPERNQEALELAQRATELAPDFDFYSTLGLAHLRLWKGDEAIQVYRTAVKMHPHEPEALTALALAIMDAKDYRLRDAEEALALAQRAIKLKPDDARARIAMSLAYREMKMWPECLHAAREAVDLAPNHPGYLQTLAILLANLVGDETLRNPAEAVKLASRAVAIQPTYYAYWLNLSLCQYRNGEYPEAVESYEEAQRLGAPPLRLGAPPVAGYALTYAMSLANLGRLAEAREMYDRAIDNLEERPHHEPALDLVRNEASALLGIESTPKNDRTPASGSQAPPSREK